MSTDSGNQTQNSGSTDSRRPVRRLQFSLATLLLFSALAVLLVALWTTSRRWKDDAAELQKFRDQVGELTISDPDKVHAIGVPTVGALKWQWRVYLPRSRRFRLYLVTGKVPKNGTSGPGKAVPSMYSPIRSGEFLLSASVQKNYRGDWVLGASAPDWNGSSPFQNEDWLNRGGRTISQIGLGKTQSVDPGTPMVLVRLRVDQGGRAPETPCDGLMIFIQEMETN